MKGVPSAAFASLILSLLLIAPLTATAASDSVTVTVSPNSVVGSATFTVSGSVTAASGDISNTAVFIQVQNPSNANLLVASAPVTGSGASGSYSKTFTPGGSSAWVNGTYKVTVTYGTTTAPPATASTTFAYSPTATTTTTTTTTTSTTTTSTSQTSTAQATTATVTSTVTTTATSVSTTTATVTSTATTTSVSVQTSTVTSTTTSTTTTSALILSTNDVVLGGTAILVLIIALAGIALIRRR